MRVLVAATEAATNTTAAMAERAGILEHERGKSKRPKRGRKENEEQG